MKIKTYIFAILLLTVPNLAVAPTAGGVDHAYPTYLKVMAFESHFDDTFHVYVFGSAKRIRVTNPKEYNIPYNEICYLTLDNKNRIVGLKFN